MFEIGDKVKLINDYNIYITAGMIGEVVSVSCTGKTIGVKFDRPLTGGSNLNGACASGYGSYIPPSFLEKVEVQNISENKRNIYLPSDVADVIIHNNTVIVNLKDGRKGISKCSDGDEFDVYCGFVNAYYRAKNDHVFDLKNILKNCVKSAEKKGYKQAILRNN